MDGSANSAVAPDKQQHNARGHFLPGHNEYRARQRRVAERLRQLAVDYDAASPANQQLLAIAAQFLDDAAVTRMAAKRASATRAAMKLLDRVPRKPEPPTPVPTLEEMLNGR